RAVRRIGEKHGFPTASYGHAGDGNLHVNFLFRSADERGRGEAAIDEVIEMAIRLGGTITGEHGVGLAKRRFLRKEQGAAVVALQKRLKRAFDPDDLLNPGKIFP
ncbi:MAG TPA: FAD-linked oxidase C-terminal domain-containing protein, partial [Myxococcales bacterium]|nr:FAD-linked oxidase C-terminal domain-containing protein [Myxococcales bacterium]